MCLHAQVPVCSVLVVKPPHSVCRCCAACLCIAQSLGHQWSSEGVVGSSELGEYLWAPGPTVYTLSHVLTLGRFERYVVQAVSRAGTTGRKCVRVRLDCVADDRPACVVVFALTASWTTVQPVSSVHLCGVGTGSWKCVGVDLRMLQIQPEPQHPRPGPRCRGAHL